MIDIVVFMGGSCGDLVTALIDDRTCEVDSQSGIVIMDESRRCLKKAKNFGDDIDKDIWLQEVTTRYRSVPSHDIDYHVKRQHRIIGITVRDSAVANWCAHRFCDCIRTQTWHNICATLSIKTVDEYATSMLHYTSMLENLTPFTISVEEILCGNALSKLSTISNNGICQGSDDFYHRWLAKNRA